jgi:hypothetical protein
MRIVPQPAMGMEPGGNWVVTRKEKVIQSAKNGDVMRSNVI